MKKGLKTILIIMLLVMEVTALGGELLQPSDIYKAASLKEKDVSEGRLAWIIEKYGIDSQMLAEISKDDLKKEILAVANDYSFLFDDKKAEPYQGETIHCIGAIRTREIANECILIDCDSRTLYYDPSKRIFDNVKNASVVVALSPVEWTAINGIITTMHFTGIEPTVNEGDVFGGHYEALGVENESGTYTYSKAGMSKTCSGLTSLIDRLFMMTEIVSTKKKK